MVAFAAIGKLKVVPAWGDLIEVVREILLGGLDEVVTGKVIGTLRVRKRCRRRAGRIAKLVDGEQELPKLLVFELSAPLHPVRRDRGLRSAITGQRVDFRREASALVPDSSDKLGPGPLSTCGFGAPGLSSADSPFSSSDAGFRFPVAFA